MRTASLLSSLLLSVSLPATSFAAINAAAPLAMQEWHVAPIGNKNTANSCALATRFTNGPTVTFTRNTGNKGAMVLDFADGEFTKDARYGVKLHYDGHSANVAARAISATQMILQTGSSRALENALAQQKPVEIELAGTEQRYSLNGQAKAFAELDACVTALIAPAQPQTQKTAGAHILWDEKVPESSVPSTQSFALTFGEETPPPVASTKESAERLKSSLAKARAEAGEKSAAVAAEKTPPPPLPAPIPAPIATKTAKPAPVASAAKANTVSHKVDAANINVPAPVTAPDLQALLFDDKTPPAKTMAPSEMPEFSKAAAVPSAPVSTQALPAPAPMEDLPPVPSMEAPQMDMTPPKLAKAEVAKAAKEPAVVLAEKSDTNELAPVATPAPAKEPTQKKVEKAVKAEKKAKAEKPKQEMTPPPLIAEEPKISNAHTPAMQVTQKIEKPSFLGRLPGKGTPDTMPRVPRPLPRTTTNASANFIPAPAHAIGSWNTRTIPGEGNEPAFCVLERNFDNEAKLLISQDTTGYSTVGVNLGIDLLQPGTSYPVRVQIDRMFEEDFNGVAESARTIIVQMGKKQSFFDAATNGQAVRIEMPGSASTFALEGVTEALQGFSSCLHDIGGAPIAAPPMMEEAVAPLAPTPVAEEALAPEPQKVAPKPAPIIPAQIPATTAVAKLPEVTAKHVEASPVMAAPSPVVAAATPSPMMTTQVSPLVEQKAPVAPMELQNILWDSKKVTAPVAATEAIALPPVVSTPATSAAAPMPIAAPIPPTPVKAPAVSWTGKAKDILQRLYNGKPAEQGDRVTWNDSNVKGSVTAIQSDDLMDATNDAMDRAQTDCAGVFDSQMGVPETLSGTTMLQKAESKCTQGAAVDVSAWLVAPQDDRYLAWQLQSKREQRDGAFRYRDKLQAILQEKK